jgi:hypothetical protein
MIRRRPAGRAIGGRAKFKREDLERLPESINKSELHKYLGLGGSSVVVWTTVGGLPFRVGERARMEPVHLIDKEDLIQWLIRTGRIYKEEWPEVE